MSEPTVVIEEVMGRARQGVTRPFICRGDDGHSYYVKGQDAGRRSLVCEWVAAQLATRFGLPIADHALAEVPAELIVPGQGLDLRKLGAGIVFASRELPHVQELSITTRALVSVEQATDVLVFDWWLHNEDRYLTELGGNPNLLWDIQTEQLAVIDHNQAFDPDFDTAHFLASHVFSACWNRVSTDLVEQAKYLEKMETVLADLNKVRDSIPEPWWFVDDGVPANVSRDEIVRCLERCRREDFWTAS